MSRDAALPHYFLQKDSISYETTQSRTKRLNLVFEALTWMSAPEDTSPLFPISLGSPELPRPVPYHSIAY